MEGGEVECQVGGVHHVLYRISTSHPPPAVRKRVVERGGCRDGRVFPYLAHYLATGDMFYPEHEGEVMVGRLLQELTRLDLVHDLLHSHKPSLAALTSCLPRPHLTHHQSEGSESVRWRRGGSNNNNSGGEEGGGGTLKVHTRRPRMVLPSLLTHLFPTTTTSTSSTPYYYNASANTHHHHSRPPPVYRPPPNKGTTVVVVSRRGESGGSRVEVHGAPGILPTLLPPHTHHHHQHHTHHHHTLARTTISTTTTTTTTTATTPSSRGQGIDASATCARVSLPPHDLLNILADKGYIPTVRSWWVCQETGGLITQWLVYKRGRRRIKSGGKTQHASSSSSSSTLSSSTLRRATSASHLLSAVSPHLSTSSTNLTTINTNNTTNTIKDVITLKGKGGEKGKGGKEKLGEGKDKREWGREKGEKKERKEEDDGAKGGVGVGGGGGINSDDEKDETKKENGGGGGGGVRGGAGGTLRNRLKTRSKSIISLATDHSTRPALTLKRLLNALL